MSVTGSTQVVISELGVIQAFGICAKSLVTCAALVILLITPRVFPLVLRQYGPALLRNLRGEVSCQI